MLFLALFTSPAYSAPSTTVGVIDTHRILQESRRANAKATELKRWRAERQNEIATALEAINKDRKNLLSPDLTQAEHDRLQTQVQEDEANLKRQMQDIDHELRKRTQAVLSAIDKELKPLIAEVAKREDIELLLDASSAQGILFVDANIDLTEDVIKLYDSRP